MSGVVNTAGLNDPQKPAISREQYDQGRAVLDSLPAGFYAKTACCGRWYTGGHYIQAATGPVCMEGRGCRS